MSKRLIYSMISFLIIILGILSRKINDVPFFIGDVLYATMCYFILKSVQPNLKLNWTFIGAIIFCFTIEISQMLHFELLDNIRNTTLGHLVLGQGFLVEDLGYYVLGSFLGLGINFIGLKLSEKKAV